MAGRKPGSKQEREKKEEVPPSSGQTSKKRNKNSGWPWWLWGVSGVAILAVVGQLFAGEEKAVATKSKAGGKKAEAGSTQAYLSLALRLGEMTQIATALKNADQLDGDATATLDTELSDIEKEIETMEDTIARDLRSMVSVIRGTIYQQSHNLSDEQVEKMNNSFTYANPRYWDDYYKKTSETERFDWYVSWDTGIKKDDFAVFDGSTTVAASQLSQIVRPYLEHAKVESKSGADAPKILMLGCGNSDMSEKMYKNGWEQIINIDISETLMKNLQEKQQAQMPKMQWMYMNASAMSFDTGSFDVTVDKGTLDAMEQNRELVLGAVRESHRILRPNGLFVSITFNPPDIRIINQLQKQVTWSKCYTHRFQKDSISAKEEERIFFVHVCVKP